MLSLLDFDDQDEKKYGLSGSPTQVQRIFPPTIATDRELWQNSSLILTDKMFDKIKELKFMD